jgi:glycosyltransferase involved in cell wall biosynthesis
LLAPVGDVAAMAAHVVRLLEDVPLRARLGAAARARAETVFPLEATVSKYEDLYRRLLDRHISPLPPSAGGEG